MKIWKSEKNTKKLPKMPIWGSQCLRCAHAYNFSAHHTNIIVIFFNFFGVQNNMRALLFSTTITFFLFFAKIWFFQIPQTKNNFEPGSRNLKIFKKYNIFKRPQNRDKNRGTLLFDEEISNRTICALQTQKSMRGHQAHPHMAI